MWTSANLRAAIVAIATATLLGGCESRIGDVAGDLVAYAQRQLEISFHAPPPVDPAEAEESEGDWDDFLAELAKYESGGRVFIDYGHAGNRHGYIGGWQFGEAALIDAGFYRGDSTPRTNDWKGKWTGLKGIGSKREFLRSPEAQWHAIRNLMPKRWVAMRNMGLDRYVGQRVAGVRVTESGMLAAAHLLGPGGVRDFLRSRGSDDPADANNVSVSTYMSLFPDYDTPYDEEALLMEVGLVGCVGAGEPLRVATC